MNCSWMKFSNENSRSLGHVWVPAARHVEGAVVVHGSEVLGAEGVELAVVGVSHYSNGTAIGVDEFTVIVGWGV